MIKPVVLLPGEPTCEAYTVRPAHLPRPVQIIVYYNPSGIGWTWQADYDGHGIGAGCETSSDYARFYAEKAASAYQVQLLERTILSQQFDINPP